MKRQLISILILLSILGACKKPQEKKDLMSSIPSIDEISSVWMSADTMAMEPSLRNFRAQALLNRDMTSISWFVSAPYSGGYHTGAMRVNGKVPMATHFRWFPYQSVRKSESDTLSFLSTVKMIPEQDGIIWEIDITNEKNEPQNLNIDIDMIGFISKYGGDWQWWYPYPKLTGSTTVRDDEVENVRKHIGKTTKDNVLMVSELIDGKPTGKEIPASWPDDSEIMAAPGFIGSFSDSILIIEDKETKAFTAFKLLLPEYSMQTKNSGGTASVQIKVNPQETKKIRYIMSWGDDMISIKSRLSNWANNVEEVSSDIKTTWEEKWYQLFSPGNELISGCFPVLESKDTVAKRIYYTGPMTMLYLMNTNLPEHKKVFLTGGPRWGASITFYWDITEWSSLWAVVDPEMMKEHLIDWMGIDPGKFYGKDNFGGKGVGNGYSANYWALFQLIRSYITTTGDYVFLDKTIGDKTVLEHLQDYALNWKKISIYGMPGAEDEIYKLADFGDDEWNLLECVPTYKHIVPSFNAGYVWMTRQLGDFFDLKGEPQKADSLRAEAETMVGHLLKLYAGDGVWYSLYPGNKKVEVRHCLDFMFMGRYINRDLSSDMKKEMVGFLDRELMTDHWMRAQSLLDPAAENSDRPDHGPLGAFDGWPAGTMDALTQMGYPEKAVNFYHSILPLVYEGTWAQAHELWGPNKKNKSAKVRIAERGWHNRDSSAGIALSQVMLKDFFGFYPKIGGDALMDIGEPQIDGTMHHVYYKGEYYKIYSDGKKMKMEKE